jgi:dUTP pyrophosphatase
MILKILKNNGTVNPPARNGDAGYDIIASREPRVVGSFFQDPYYTSIHYIEYDTEINLEPERIDGDYEFFLLLYPRSSIIKTNLILSNSVGVIDSGYRGNIKVCFKYIAQPEDMKLLDGEDIEGNSRTGIVTSINPQRIYSKGDKIAQLIPCNHEQLVVEYTNELNNSERGIGGFGSTGS